MEPNRRPPEFALSIHADPACAKDMIKGLLHTIFFHRTFTAIRPLNRDILGVTLPLVDDADLETLIDARATALVRQIESSAAIHHHQQYSSPYGSGNNNNGGGGGGAAAAAGGPAGGNNPGNGSNNGAGTPAGRGQLAVQFFERRRRKTYFFGKNADEEVCWEQWNVDVLVSKAKNEAEGDRLRRIMENSLESAAMQVINIASAEKDHIPPITTQDMNPFPYQIILREQGWGKTIGIF